MLSDSKNISDLELDKHAFIALRTQQRKPCSRSSRGRDSSHKDSLCEFFFGLTRGEEIIHADFSRKYMFWECEMELISPWCQIFNPPQVGSPLMETNGGAWGRRALHILSLINCATFQLFQNILALGRLTSGHQARSSDPTCKHVPCGSSENTFYLLIWDYTHQAS